MSRAPLLMTPQSGCWVQAMLLCSLLTCQVPAECWSICISLGRTQCQHCPVSPRYYLHYLQSTLSTVSRRCAAGAGRGTTEVPPPFLVPRGDHRPLQGHTAAHSTSLHLYISTS